MRKEKGKEKKNKSCKNGEKETKIGNCPVVFSLYFGGTQMGPENWKLSNHDRGNAGQPHIPHEKAK